MTGDDTGAGTTVVYDVEGGLERENEGGLDKVGGPLLMEFVSDSVLDLRALAIDVARGL